MKAGNLDKDVIAFYLNRSYYNKLNGKRIKWNRLFNREEEPDTLYKSLGLESKIEELNQTMNKNIQLKSLGLLGGTSWHSTIDYYKSINQQINDFYGDNTNPPLLVFTLNQSLIHKYQKENQWDKIADIFIDGAIKLKAAGAEKIMFCANTPHKIYDKVQEAIDIPIIHIADATAKSINSKGVNKVLFLGTKYTMTESFITKRISKNNIEVYTPDDIEVINELHRIILDELVYGKILDESKKYVLNVIDEYLEKGVNGVVLGCTEFPLMIFQKDLDVPIFNTTEIHSKAGVDFILENIKG